MNKAMGLVMMVMSMTIVSCNKEDNLEKNVSNPPKYELNSNLSQEEFRGVITNLAQCVGNNTRTSNITGGWRTNSSWSKTTLEGHYWKTCPKSNCKIFSGIYWNCMGAI